MADCAMIETASSHWIPELIGAIISTSLVGVSLFIFFDWRMVLASFWVIPASFLLVRASVGYQKKAVKHNNGVKMELAEGIQECLESVRDLRANNAQDAYMDGLDVKIKNVERGALHRAETRGVRKLGGYHIEARHRHDRACGRCAACERQHRPADLLHVPHARFKTL